MRIREYTLIQCKLQLMNSNMFLLLSDKSLLIIDPNNDGKTINVLKNTVLSDIAIILTHEHFDHISGVNTIRSLLPDNCKVIASEKCADMITDPDKNLSRFLEAMFITRSEEERLQAMRIFDKDYSCFADITFTGSYEFVWHDLTVRLRETPGHSPGSICAEIYDNNGTILALATGDSLVQGNKVVTRLPGGDRKVYNEYTRPYLEQFDESTLVLPGHGEISYMRDLELG